MNELELRDSIKARIARRTVHVSPEMENYMKCMKCSAEFEWLYVGGTGDWQTTITCEKCLAVRKGVPFRSVIVPLVALQYGLTEADALEREERAQRAYLASIAAQSTFG